MQQVLAFESDLLEYDDLFAGSRVVEAKVAEVIEGAQAEIGRVREMGGAIAAVESGYANLRWSPRTRCAASGSSPARTSSWASTASRPPSPAR